MSIEKLIRRDPQTIHPRGSCEEAAPVSARRSARHSREPRMGRLTGVARLALVACLLPSGAFAEPVDVREGVDAARSPHAQVDWIREPGGEERPVESGGFDHWRESLT